MLTKSSPQPMYLPLAETPAPVERDDGFLERRRIALLECDTALRAVMVRALLRIGCIVTFKHHHEQVTTALQSGELGGVVLALPMDEAQLATLLEANVQRIPIVVLTDTSPPLHLAQRDPSLHFLQKPFDMRELLTLLNLPHKATIITVG